MFYARFEKLNVGSLHDTQALWTDTLFIRELYWFCDVSKPQPTGVRTMCCKKWLIGCFWNCYLLPGPLFAFCLLFEDPKCGYNIYNIYCYRIDSVSMQHFKWIRHRRRWLGWMHIKCMIVIPQTIVHIKSTLVKVRERSQLPSKVNKHIMSETTVKLFSVKPDHNVSLTLQWVSKPWKTQWCSGSQTNCWQSVFLSFNILVGKNVDMVNFYIRSYNRC